MASWVGPRFSVPVEAGGGKSVSARGKRTSLQSRAVCAPEGPWPACQRCARKRGFASLPARKAGREHAHEGKYPPAKPGALRSGPLKGAQFATFYDVRKSTLVAGLSITLWGALHRRCVTRLYAKSMGALPRFGLLHESEPRGRVPREMSNIYCHPGKAGGLSLTLGPRLGPVRRLVKFSLLFQ